MNQIYYIFAISHYFTDAAGGFKELPTERHYGTCKSVRFYLSRVWAYPSAWNEFSIYPFVQPLNSYFSVFVLAELVFDVHDDVYSFQEFKARYALRLGYFL